MKGYDLSTALESLLTFRKDRDWEQFHTPKNLSMSIAIEAAELMEHFQWKTDEEAKEYLLVDLEKVKEEIADIAAYLLLLSHDMGIDLNETVLKKIKKNEEKYPVDKSKGRSNKYNNL